VRGYVSTCFVCPYEGAVAKEKVASVAKALFDVGVDEVSIGDTIGAATPRDVEATGGVLLEQFSVNSLALHFHDTYGMAVANVYQSLRMGFFKFDSSAGGLGGCPYAPGATGNVATEDVVHMLQCMGYDTGMDLDGLISAAAQVGHLVRHDLPSQLPRAGHRLTKHQPPADFPEIVARAAARQSAKGNAREALA